MPTSQVATTCLFTSAVVMRSVPSTCTLTAEATNARLCVVVVLQVVTAVANEDPRSAALSELVVRLVNDSLTEYSYAAHVAELYYDLKATDTGFQVSTIGLLLKNNSTHRGIATEHAKTT